MIATRSIHPLCPRPALAVFPVAAAVLGLFAAPLPAAEDPAVLSARLTLTANPVQIESDGEAEVRILATHVDGSPVPEGTRVRLSSTLGTLPPWVEVNGQGEATAIFRGEGHLGRARVEALIPGNALQTARIEVGSSAGSITLQVTPSTIPATGGEVSLHAIVRDLQGRPLPGAQVNFLTGTGALSSGGTLVTTDAEGGASDRLTLTPAELALEGGAFDLSVAVGSQDEYLKTASARVGILRAPEAVFQMTDDGLVVAFDDFSDGHITSWKWDFGDGSSSTRQSPGHVYSEGGSYVVTLTVENEAGSDETSRLVRVLAR